MTEPVTAPSQWIDFASAVLGAEGVPAKDAHLVADSLGTAYVAPMEAIGSL